MASSKAKLTEKERQYVCSVYHFWDSKEDPTRYADWDEAETQRLMPAFYEAWTKFKVYRELTNLAARSAYEKVDG